MDQSDFFGRLLMSWLGLWFFGGVYSMARENGAKPWQLSLSCFLLSLFLWSHVAQQG